MLSFSNTSATVNDDPVQLTDDADLPQELLPILKHTTLEEKEAEDLKGNNIPRTSNSSEAFTTQYTAWLQTFILVLGN